MSALARRAGALFALFLLSLALLSLPAFAATNVVYVADIGGVIYRFDTGTGNSLPYVSDSRLAGAVGVVQEASGDLLVSTVGSNKIWRIDHVSRALTVVSQGGLFQNPTLMGIVGNEVFVCDPVADAVFGVNRTTGAQRVVVNGGLSGGGPWMCAGTDGFLYVSRNANTTIVRVNPATGAENVVTSGNLLTNILDVTYAPDNFLYVCCGGAQSIVRVNPTTGAQSLVTQGGFGSNPYGISGGTDGYLWVGLEQSNQLARVVPGTGARTIYTIPGMAQPYGVQQGTDATIPPPPPGAPQTCSASEDRPDSVVVQWTAGSGQIDFFQIDRDGTTITTLDPTVSRYAERPSAGQHNYCVRSGNLGGTSPACCDLGQLKPIVPQPHLDFVRDVPNDQGGKVMLGWARSDLDIPGGSIYGYRVWRRLPLQAQAGNGLALLSAGGREIRTMTVGPQTVYWEALVDLPAGHLPGYGYTAATLQDSLPGSNPFTAFFVTALTEYSDVFYDSNVDSGYSVDNLAPDIPQGMQGAYLNSGGIKIKWVQSRAPDVGHYDVYRGSSANFVPANANRLGTTTDTTFVDPNAASYYYKLSAVDVHGNESGFALLKPSDIPVAALLESFTAEPAVEGVQISLLLAGAPGNYGVRLWRSETDSRLGAVALSTDPVSIPSTGYQTLDSGAPKDRLWYWADLYGTVGFVATFGPVTVVPGGALPNTILLAPQPNPSTSNVEFGYTVGSDQGSKGNVPVKLALFDTRGKLVRVLKSDAEPVGHYQVHWDGTDEHGARVGTGVYQYKLQVGTQIKAGKVIRL